MGFHFISKLFCMDSKGILNSNSIIRTIKGASLLENHLLGIFYIVFLGGTDFTHLVEPLECNRNSLINKYCLIIIIYLLQLSYRKLHKFKHFQTYYQITMAMYVKYKTGISTGKEPLGTTDYLSKLLPIKE